MSRINIRLSIECNDSTYLNSSRITLIGEEVLFPLPGMGIEMYGKKFYYAYILSNQEAFNISKLKNAKRQLIRQIKILTNKRVRIV